MVKNLGQFYTEPEIAELMISLSGAKKTGTVLEPSFGRGVFLKELKNQGFKNVSGVELDRKNFQVVKKELGNKVSISHQDFFQPIAENFDLIIGNPPYVKMKNVSRETRQLINKDQYLASFVSNQADLFYFFILKSIDLLNPGGELIFIVPENFINATFAKNLRKELESRGEFFGLIDLSENRVFKNAGPDPIIFAWKKGLKNHSFNAVFFKKRGLSPKVIKKEALAGIKKDLETPLISSFKTSNFSEKWYAAKPEEEKLIEKIEANSVPIKKIGKTAVGFISAAENVFQKPDNLKIEPGALIKIVKANNCEKFSLKASSEMIFLNNITSEQELKNKYPETYAYLTPFKQKLLNRWGIKNNWWHWPTVRNADVFKKEGGKIFVPGIERGGFRFALDFENLIASGDVLTIVPENINPYFLTGWLNSEVFAGYFKIKGDKTGQRYYFRQKSFAEQPVLSPGLFNKSEILKIEKMVKKKDVGGINLIFSEKINKIQ